MRYISKNQAQTKKIAGDLVPKILAKKRAGKYALVILLSGELGSGKTTFAQGFLHNFIKRKTQSPTFILWRRFSIPAKKSQIFRNIFHIDCYRLKNSKATKTLNLKEILNNPQNIALIEWPERIVKLLPKKTIGISLKHKNPSDRIINIRL